MLDHTDLADDPFDANDRRPRLALDSVKCSEGVLNPTDGRLLSLVIVLVGYAGNGCRFLSLVILLVGYSE